MHAFTPLSFPKQYIMYIPIYDIIFAFRHNLQYTQEWREIMKYSTFEPITQLMVIIGLFVVGYGFAVKFL